MKILLLEDDEILNEVICSFLKKKGYEVCVTYSGDEAEDELYKNSFDLFLFDVNVPNINGFKLLKNIPTLLQETGKKALLFKKREIQDKEIKKKIKKRRNCNGSLFNYRFGAYVCSGHFL